MAILVARQETVGETSTVHFSGECGRCSAKLKWHRKIVAVATIRYKQTAARVRLKSKARMTPASAASSPQIVPRLEYPPRDEKAALNKGEWGDLADALLVSGRLSGKHSRWRPGGPFAAVWPQPGYRQVALVSAG